MHRLISSVASASSALRDATIVRWETLATNVHRLLLADGRVVVAKLYEPAGRRACEREAAALSHAASAPTVPGPRLIEVGRLGNGRAYLLASNVEGIRASEAIARGVDRSGILGRLGQALASFHRTSRSLFGQVAETGWHEPTAGRLLARLVADEVGLLDSHGLHGLARAARQAGRAADAVVRDTEPAAFCHGDLHLDNTMVVRSGPDWAVTGVVDFESSIYAFPEYDLAKSLVVCSALGGTDRRALEHGYMEGGGRVRRDLTTELLKFHAIEGWLHAATVERRDRELWHTRLTVVLGAEGGVP